MLSLLRLSLAAVLIIQVSINAFGQIVSDFSTNADGWGTLVVSSGSPAVAANYNGTGGNPGGFISIDITNPSTPFYFYADRYFDAPIKFLGNRSLSYNQNLTFDLQQSLLGSDASTAEVIITSPNGSIFFPLSASPGTSLWTSYSVQLNEAVWKFGSLAGLPPSKSAMKSILGNITSLRIKAQFFPTFPVGNYSCRLDNVVLNQAPLPIPPMVTSFSPMSGVPGTTVTITGSNFNSTVAQNAVYFNGVKGILVATSATQLTVTTPQKTTYGPITVINLANGSQSTSNQNFNPLFDNNKDFGGTVIPSSFARKVEFGTSANEVGMSVGDLDGDGLIDVLTSGNDLNASVFRNAGQTGVINSSSFALPLILSIPNGLLSGNPGPVSRVGQNSITDMDGDGKLDLVINVGYNQGGNYDNGMVIFLNQSTPGNLSFSTGSVFQFPTVNNNNQGMSIIDIDGDGRPEFLGALFNSACHLGIAQNLSSPGNLDFAAVQDFALGATMGGPISWGDLNGDGKPEIISEAYLGGNVFVWENLSTSGNLAMGTPFSVSTLTAQNFQVIDLDNDGKNDLLFKDAFSGIIHIKKNIHTTGSLSAADFGADILVNSFYSSGGNVGYVGVADVNGDNLIDIIANNGTHMIVYQNKFSGTLSSSSFHSGINFEGKDFTNTHVICADIDGDNKPEILIKSQVAGTGKSFKVYRNECYPAPRIDSMTPSSGVISSIVNFTGDHFSTGNAPVITGRHGVIATSITPTSNTSASTSVSSNSIGNRFSITEHGLTGYTKPFNVLFPTNQIINSTSFGPNVDFALVTNTRGGDAIAIADFDDDGKPDVAVADNNFITRVFQNIHPAPGQSLTTSSLTQLATTYSGGASVIALDVDGDGKTDLNHGIGLLQNNSTVGSLSFLASVNMNATGQNYAPADFNKDGKIDLAINKGGLNIDVYENQSTNGAFGSNANIFSSYSITSISLPRPGTGGGIVAEDFDGDGFEDILSANLTTDNITIFLNTQKLAQITSASFQFLSNFSTPIVGGKPISMTANDFDGDGKIDLAVAFNNNPFVSVYLNTSVLGNISFTAPINLTCLNNGYNIVSRDLDGDGKAEIIITHQNNPTPGSFSIFKNNSSPGNALFSAVVNYPLSRNPQDLAIADINQDQKPDILIAATGGSSAPANALMIFENRIASNTITITQQPADFIACDGQLASFSSLATGTTNITYQWQFSPDGISAFSDISNGSSYSNVTTSTLTINTTGTFGAGRYRCKISGDFAPTIYTNDEGLFINTIPAAPGVSPTSNCGPGSVTLSATGGTNGQYRWYTVSSGGLSISGETNSTYTTPALATTTTYFVALTNGSCESTRTPADAIINSIPSKPVIISSITPTAGNVSVCSTNTLTLTAPTGFTSYSWSNGELTQQITITSSGNYSVVVNSAGCVSPSSDALTVTIVPAPCVNQPPVINTTVTSTTIGSVATINLVLLTSDADNNLDLNSFQIISQPISGATANITNGILTINYAGNSFVGTDLLTIKVCDLLGACSQQILEIEVTEELAFEIYNAVSPNNDGKNDTFIIANIDKLPETQSNTVSIYNRWGSKVFEVDDYNNTTKVFKGFNNNGNELPSGTYFYKIIFKSGRKSENGYLVLKR
jgi:gliding motility-associated-like protein